MSKFKRMKAIMANKRAIADELEKSDDPSLQREAQRQRQEVKGLGSEMKSRTPCPDCGRIHS